MLASYDNVWVHMHQIIQTDDSITDKTWLHIMTSFIPGMA